MRRKLGNNNENINDKKRQKRIKRLIYLLIFLIFIVIFVLEGMKISKTGYYFIFDGIYIGRYKEEWMSAKGSTEFGVKKDVDIKTDDLKKKIKYYVSYDEKDALIDASLDDELTKQLGSYIMNTENDWGIIASSYSKHVSKPEVTELDENELDEEIYQKAILDIIKNAGGKNETVNIEKVFQVDIDGDNEKEKIVIARNLKNENGDIIDTTPDEVKNKNYFIYDIIVMFKKVNNEYISILINGNLLKKDVVDEKKEFSDKAHTNSEIYFYDLNIDGKPEIIINRIFWNISDVVVYEYNGYKFKPVLYSELPRV